MTKSLTRFRLIYLEKYTSIDYLNFFKNNFENVELYPVKLTTSGNSFVKEDLYKMKNTSLPIVVLFTGGEDVNPVVYSENKHPLTLTNDKRDDLETKFYNFFTNNNNTLKLGICRGAQLLTVLAGGSLIQHVTNHNTDHEIYINNKHLNRNRRDIIMVNSSHHQMMYPFNISNNNYEIIGYSKVFLSDKYESASPIFNVNKIVETDLHPKFIEPEIVYYKQANSLAIQGHPEWSNASKEFIYYTTKLIDTYV